MKAKQATLGLLVIVAGALILLSNINIVPIREFVRDWWPVAIIIAGLYSLWGNPRQYVWPMIMVVVGITLLLNTLGVAHVSVGALIFPLILFGVGINILTNARARRPIKVTESDEEIVAILGGSSSKNTSDDYHGSVITAILGGIELDLSKVKIEKEAVLRVSVVMGGIDLRVPDEVVVVNRTQSILGGIDVKSQPSPVKSAPKLIIEGQIIMGGIDVKR
ncbi:MAG: DUF5668 domain-containing protein [Candidatus Saccharimonas sp.]